VTNPLSRRLLQLAGLLSLLLIAVVVNYLLHGGASVVNPVAEAAQRTAAMPGAKLKLEVAYSSEGSSKVITGTGTGVYDGRSGRSEIQFTMPLPDGTSLSVEAVGDQRSVYTRSSALEPLLPPGRLWLGMQPLLGHEPAGGVGGGPGAEGMLEQLEAAGGDVEEIDHQTVAGHPTTRYKATIDPAREADIAAKDGDPVLAREYDAVAEGTEPVAMEVWIDGHGLARMIASTEKVPIPDGKSLDIRTRMEFSAFGHESHISLPPKRQVFDYTPILRAELGLEDGTSYGVPNRPAGARPLTAAAFRHQADAICGRTYTEARGLLPQEQSLIERLKGLDAHDPGVALPLLRRLSHWFEGPLFRVWHRQFRELNALVPPAEDAATFRRFQLLEAESTERSLAAAHAFQVGLTKLPNPLGHGDTGEHRREEINSLGAKLGITECTKKLGAANSSAELS
jgi:hypothetical protein